jgi:type VI secretion system protein ImpJ
MEEFSALLHSALPGIPAMPLAVHPPQIPWHAGMTYFELDRSSPYWRNLASATALAIHVVGDFPELDIQCWAIPG